MKPLLETKVKRGVEVDEWVSAEAQKTMGGCADFWKRQQERIKLAQANRVEQTEKVRTLKVKA